ncbi:MAG: hypothetical protein P4M11_00070 [Candidatus Pacebacteria bacterium]|nr:hypothetical protein [Candidatus Paceibacterota bacterium]
MDSHGSYVHVYYPDVKCWQAMHILHAVLAVVVSLVFIFIALVVTFTFYETKTVTSNAGAKYRTALNK